MKFSEQEKQILLFILKQIVEKQCYGLQSNADSVKELILKLEAEEYIRGRFLHVLYFEVNKNSIPFDDERDVILSEVLKRIKFKSIPR